MAVLVPGAVGSVPAATGWQSTLDRREDMTALVARALYAAKAGGRNR